MTLAFIEMEPSPFSSYLWGLVALSDYLSIHITPRVNIHALTFKGIMSAIDITGGINMHSCVSFMSLQHFV